jgi:hypothetical protein
MSDVLLNSEEVIWIVFPLNIHQTIVIVSVGCFDSVESNGPRSRGTKVQRAVTAFCVRLAFARSSLSLITRKTFQHYYHPSAKMPLANITPAL